VKALLGTLILSGLALGVQAGPRSATVRDWTFKDFGDGTSGGQTMNESGSALGVFCAAVQQCSVFLRTTDSCTDGNKYTVMVNSDSGASALSATCANIGTPDSKGQFAIFFDDFQSVLNVILKDHAIGIAIPLASGQFKVVRFSLEGSNEVLAAVGEALGPKSKAKPAVMKDQVL
jgi:hypothetical protein